MSEWLKILTGSLCILTILFHLLPQGKFGSYVRFYGGLLFFLVAVGPLLNFFFGEGELERLLKLEFLKEEYYDARTSVEGMAELKNERILAAYRRELERQVKEIAAAYGVEAVDVEMIYDREDEYALKEISLKVDQGTSGGGAVSSAQKEIAEVFALKPDEIHIMGQGADHLEAVDR